MFAAMFHHSMKESQTSRVRITDMEPEIFAEMLRYIYSNEVSGLDTIAGKLLAAADKVSENKCVD